MEDDDRGQSKPLIIGMKKQLGALWDWEHEILVKAIRSAFQDYMSKWIQSSAGLHYKERVLANKYISEAHRNNFNRSKKTRLPTLM